MSHWWCSKKEKHNACWRVTVWSFALIMMSEMANSSCLSVRPTCWMNNQRERKNHTSEGVERTTITIRISCNLETNILFISICQQAILETPKKRRRAGKNGGRKTPKIGFLVTLIRHQKKMKNHKMEVERAKDEKWIKNLREQNFYCNAKHK